VMLLPLDQHFLPPTWGRQAEICSFPFSASEGRQMLPRTPGSPSIHSTVPTDPISWSDQQQPISHYLELEGTWRETNI
jgi:hypothetical protein